MKVKTSENLLLPLSCQLWTVMAEVCVGVVILNSLGASKG